MRRFPLKFALTAAGLVLASGVALAAHGKAGEWEMTMTLDMSGVQMPDLSSLSPEMRAQVEAQMKAAGVSANGNTVTSHYCMTAAQVANDTPALGTGNRSCTLSNVKFANQSMTADMTCTGSFTGTGHVTTTYDSAEHYTSQVTMTGTSNGHPISRGEKLEGHWLSPQCTTPAR